MRDAVGALIPLPEKRRWDITNYRRAHFQQLGHLGFLKTFCPLALGQTYPMYLPPLESKERTKMILCHCNLD